MPQITEAPKHFDFIVAGGGTAGCVIAGRLAENPNVHVLVIEAGMGNPEEVDAITTPARAFELRGSKYDWQYKTTMVDRLENTRIEKPNTRGKVLGGSSCLNYYTWLPGSAATFDEWAEFGGDEWTWDNVKEYLRKFGLHQFPRPAKYHDDRGRYSPELKYIGQDGPLPVSHADLIPELKPFRDALRTAWVSKGEKLTEDVHGGTMRGLWNCTNSIYNGKRSSSWMYLKGKDNVAVLGRTHARKIIIEDDKAKGIEVTSPDDETYTFYANYEVIVSEGVFETPKLLMLSGIGPKKDPGRFRDREGCGFGERRPTPARPPHHPPRLQTQGRLRIGRPHPPPRRGARRRRQGVQQREQGPYTSGLLELVGLPRIDSWLEQDAEYVSYKQANGGVDPFGPQGQPHLEIDFVPMFSDAFQWHIPCPPEGDWLTVIVDLVRPRSRNGVVTLRSADPLEDPSIDINFLEDKLDIIALRQGLRFVDDILMNGEGMKDIIGEDYPFPVPRNSDEGLNTMIKERFQTGFHPCGTCRLGKDIGQGVVDSKLKVFGVDRLRVVDASVIPVIPDCRIQNAVYMIGEKGADMIKATYPNLYA